MELLLMNAKWLIDYLADADKVALAIQGLTRNQMVRVAPSNLNIGLWSIQQIVMHISDADQVLADRMKRVIAEDNPTLQAYDESLWIKNLHYDELSPADAAEIVRLVRKQMHRILVKLPPDAFSRFGTHSEMGIKTLEDLVVGAVKHLRHHLEFIEKKKGWLCQHNDA
jgi:hypothetical protein